MYLFRKISINWVIVGVLSTFVGIGIGVILSTEMSMAPPIILISVGGFIVGFLYKYFRLKPWEILFLLLWASGFVFRSRDIYSVENQLIDIWALYRLGLVAMVGILWFFFLLKYDILPFLFRPPLIYFTLLASWQIASSLWSINPLWTLYRGVEYFINVGVIAVIVAKARQIDDWRRITNLAWAVVFILVSNIYFQSLLFPDRALEFTKGIIGFRIGSFFPLIGGNGAGEFSALLALIGFARMLLDKSSKSGVILFAFGLVGLVLSESRSPFAGLIIGIITMLVCIRKLNFKASLPFLLLAVFWMSPMADWLWAWLWRGQSEQAFMSLTGRTEYWNTTLRYLIDRGKLLCGDGAYAVSRFLIFRILNNPKGSHLHNAFIETIGGSGLVGVLLLSLGLIHTWALVLGASQAVQLKGKTWGKKKILLAELAGAFGLWTVRAFFSSSIFIWHPAVLYLLPIGFAVFLRREHNESYLYPKPLPAARR